MSTCGSSQTIIAPHTRVLADIQGSGDLVLLGTCKGEIHLQGRLSVQGKGLLKGNVYAEEIEVHGVVIGELRAQRSIILGPKARVIGALTAPSIEVLEGAQFQGPVKSQAPQPVQAKPFQVAPQSRELGSSSRRIREQADQGIAGIQAIKPAGTSCRASCTASAVRTPGQEVTAVTEHQDLESRASF